MHEKHFPGYRAFEPNQIEPEEYLTYINKLATRLTEGSTTDTTVVVGFDTKRAQNMGRDILQNKAFRCQYGHRFKDRNYLLEVMFKWRDDEEIVTIINELRQFGATDVSMIPINEKAVPQLYRVFDKARCPVLLLTSD